jgi:hypothetical protein
MISAKSPSNPWLDSDVVLAGECRRHGAEQFFTSFHMTEKQIREYRPLFLAMVSSCSGEITQSFGLFERSGVLWEVTGTECSVWNFNGQFEPEPTNPVALRHRVVNGDLGKSDSDGGDLYGQDLLRLLDSPGMRLFQSGKLNDEGRVALGFIPGNLPHMTLAKEQYCVPPRFFPNG